MANKKYLLSKGNILKSPELLYKVEEVLGYGGFGITYKVSADVMQGNIPIHTFFAVKEHFLSECCERSDGATVLVSKTQSDTYKDSLADFKSEAIRLNELSGLHKGIVRVNEVFNANNTVYYVMEFLNGRSIRKEVKDNGPYSETDALSLIREIADAISFLHKERITHLDIKPDNIILHTFPNEDSPYPVLIDFGLAKHYDKDGRVTSTIRVQGCSEGYSPVEQYVRIDRFSPTADIYALGATLFFMLTGKDPIIASDITEDYILSHLPANVSESTRNGILGAMKKEKNNRTNSVEKFLSDLGVKSIEIEDKLPVRTKPLRKQALNKIPKYAIWLAAAFFAILGYLTPSLFTSNMEEDVIVEDLSTEEEATKTLPDSEQTDHDMQNAAVEDSIDIKKSIADKEKLYKDFLAKVDECCNKAEKRHGDNSTIQTLLDAKYYYYDRAQSLSRELYNKSLQPNQRLDDLVTKEFNYWVEQGNKMGKNRRNFELKKTYYERAYKLRENQEIKARIEWLKDQLSKKRR